MTSKKYLTLEEAAKILGVSPKELTKIREEGQIRGFADRGTWKFRQEDVDKVKRMRQSDSSPDVPLVTDDDAGFGSSVVLGDDDEDELGAQPTIIRGSALDDDELDAGTSDSDVRLILDDSLVSSGDSKLDVSLSLSDSDSDVRLTEDKKKSKAIDQSDSDVKLVASDSDSDVKLSADDSALQSDSDVKLVGDSDSDVRLSDDSGPKSDSDVKIYDGDDADHVPSDSDQSDVKILDLEKTTIGGESDLLFSGSESGVLEDHDESGSTSVFNEDSGIALEAAADSGISLAPEGEDSGISLVADDDDGITLAEDSGISIATNLDDSDSAETINMLSADSSSEMEATSFDVASGGDSEFDLDAEDSSHDTSVILFDDDEDADFATTKPQRGSDDAVAVEEADLELDGDMFDVDEADELDVFDAGDEAFEDSFQTGASHAEFSTGSAIGRGVVSAPEAEWTKIDFAGVALSTVVTILCALVSFDLVRSIWHSQDNSAVAGPIIEALAGLF
ncbi:MAG: helix-turn-helix domain-containing protein [Planctomycetota bacterium]|nr:helix-turn-helix domain-containing protein [Planctomycetota bacterium]MDA1212922.1 helix-turn-helix domain-containing protein [Planctomycetota bacterium]